MPKLYAPSRGRRGLLMVDLVVSVAIIAVLAAILFPVFAQAREAARKTSCRTNLHQIGLALHQYARDHDGRLPPGRYMTPLLGAYVATPLCFRCPSETDGVQIGTTKMSSQGAGSSLWNGGRLTVPQGHLYCSYQYAGGLTLDSPGPAWLAGDRAFLHQQRAMTLNLAGEVRPLARSEWKAYALAPALNARLTQAGASIGDNAATPFLRAPGERGIPTRPNGIDPTDPPLPGTAGVPGFGMPGAPPPGAPGGNGP